MYQNELYHHGIKGQRWGIQNGPPYPLNSPMSESKARKCAKKDAKEFARAKMFYGEGAGNRRKLIKNIVEERSKDSVYKKAFDEALSKQDMAKHAQKAKQERQRKDTVNSVKKTGRGIVNIATGHPERVGAALAGAAAIAGIAHKTGADKVIANAAKSKLTDIRNSVSEANGQRWVKKRMNTIKFEVRDN